MKYPDEGILFANSTNGPSITMDSNFSVNHYGETINFISDTGHQSINTKGIKNINLCYDKETNLSNINLKLNSNNSTEINGYNNSQLIYTGSLGNTFYGNLQGTADNALLFDDMTSDDVYHVNNKPTKADVGLDKVQNQYNYGHVEVNSGQLGAGYLTLNNCRVICQRYSINVTASQFGAAGSIYLAQIDTNLLYYWEFKTVPNVVMGTYIQVGGLIDVRPTRWDKSKITQLQVFSYSPSINGEIPVVIFAMGEV